MGLQMYIVWICKAAFNLLVSIWEIAVNVKNMFPYSHVNTAIGKKTYVQSIYHYSVICSEQLGFMS